MIKFSSISVNKILQRQTFKNKFYRENLIARALVVAQLSEWSFPAPKVSGSNPFIRISIYCEVLKIREEKILGMVHQKSFTILMPRVLFILPFCFSLFVVE